MIKGGVGGANTQTGIAFEKKASLTSILGTRKNYSIAPLKNQVGCGIYYKAELIARSFQKGDFKRYLKEAGHCDLTTFSHHLQPDDAILVLVRDTLFVFEIKVQHGGGSVDEKLQTCDYKKKYYQRCLMNSGILVEFVYILSDWFKQPRYRDVLTYIQSVGCKYFFNEVPLRWIGFPED
jgi:hypothetical protein